MNTILAAILLVVVSSIADAQSARQFHDELFCHDFGMSAYTALADYRDGLPEDAALTKADNYLCTDRIQEICESKRNTLRDNTRLVYEDMGPNLNVRRMSTSQFLQFNGVNRDQATSACLSQVRGPQS